MSLKAKFYKLFFVLIMTEYVVKKQEYKQENFELC